MSARVGRRVADDSLGGGEGEGVGNGYLDKSGFRQNQDRGDTKRHTERHVSLQGSVHGSQRAFGHREHNLDESRSEDPQR